MVDKTDRERESIEYEFYHSATRGLIRRRRIVSHYLDPELWVPNSARRFFRTVIVPGGQWKTASPAVDREIHGLGDDPWSGPEDLPVRLSLDEARALGEESGIDLFAENQSDSTGN